MSTLTRQAARVPIARHARLSSPRVYQRLYSTQPETLNKICTIPFAQTPEKARERLLVNGLLASAKWPNIAYAGLIRFFGMAMEPIGKEFGLGESLKMRDMKAALWPTWRVDVMGEGRAEPTEGGKAAEGWYAVREGYIPGNAFAPLSYLSYAVPPLEDELPVFDPDSHLHQLGDTEIVQVPFTVSPFALLDKLKSRIGRRTDWRGERIDADSWKETLVAAYPIYFPMYIAEFEVETDEGKRSYNVIMDAHDENMSRCRVSFPPPMEMRESGRFTNNFFVNPAPFLPTVHFVLPNAHGGFPPKPHAVSIMEAYQEWMSPAPDGNTIPASPTYSVAEEGSVNWSDRRIQSWSGEERLQNREYLDKAEEVYNTVAAIETMVSISGELQGRGDDVIVAVGREKGRSMKVMKEEMDENVAKLKTELEELRPDWLGEKGEDAAKESKEGEQGQEKH